MVLGRNEDRAVRVITIIALGLLALPAYAQSWQTTMDYLNRPLPHSIEEMAAQDRQYQRDQDMDRRMQDLENRQQLQERLGWINGND
jgi:hypothetical protein